MYYYNNKIYKDKNLTAEEEVDSFLKKHEATGELSTRRLYYKRQPIRYSDWLADGSPIPFDQAVEREPMVEINMPQHRFKQLVEREQWYSRLERESDYYRGIVEQYREDERIRDRNPAVAKAWRNYLTLLELSR